MRSLEGRFIPPSEVSGDVVIMLGGGATLDTPDVTGKGQLSSHASNRLLTVALLQKKLNVPIILAGGQVYAAVCVNLNTPGAVTGSTPTAITLLGGNFPSSSRRESGFSMRC